MKDTMSALLLNEYRLWAQRVDKLMVYDYCLSIDEAGISKTDLRNYFGLNLDPHEFVQWFATKYDLDARRSFF